MVRGARVASVLLLLLVVPAGSCADERADAGRRGDEGPKNVVLLVSDGAGFAHFEAASLHARGAIATQACYAFPVRLAMSTYPAGGAYDAERPRPGATDSAAAITAMLCGVKTRNGTLGLDADGRSHPTVAERMAARGKATGVVTSVPFSHATPAGVASHVASRNEYGRIAEALLFESDLDVLFGCGHPHYDDDGRPRDEPDYRTFGGRERWERLLAMSGPDRWTLVHSRPAVRALAAGPAPRRVFGLPRVAATLQQRRAGDPHAAPGAVPPTPDVPTLAEMTAAALGVLGADPDGFFLLVEGGAVDWAGHTNQLGRMIEEQRDFDAATDVVLRWVDARGLWDETLVVVTSDHECGDLSPPVLVDGQVRAHWRSMKHTNRLVPLFAKGRGAEALLEPVRGTDVQRGPWIDNTDLGRILLSWFAPEVSGQ